jgi:hypothetical protein
MVDIDLRTVHPTTDFFIGMFQQIRNDLFSGHLRKIDNWFIAKITLPREHSDLNMGKILRTRGSDLYLHG